MKNKRLYNVVFTDHTATSVEAFNKPEAKQLAEMKYKKKASCITRCYKRKEENNDK